MSHNKAVLTDDQIDRIARRYFAEEYGQQQVKNAIHDAFQEAAVLASADNPSKPRFTNVEAEQFSKKQHEGSHDYVTGWNECVASFVHHFAIDVGADNPSTVGADICRDCGTRRPLHLLTCSVAEKGMAEGKKKEAPEPLRQLLIDLSNNTYFCGLHLEDDAKYASYLAAAEKAEQGLIELFGQVVAPALNSSDAQAPQQDVVLSAVEALKELMSIVRIHSAATGDNFAWAEMQYAQEVLAKAAQASGKSEKYSRIGQCVAVAVGSERIIIAGTTTVEWADRIVAALAAPVAQSTAGAKE